MLHINGLTYRIEGRTIFEGASVHVPKGHVVGVVGPNGAGKTTLFRLINGDLHADDGDLRSRRNARISLIAQEAPDGSASPLETVLAADRERAELLARSEIATEPQEIADIHHRLADINAHGAPARAARMLAGLGFSEAEQGRPLDSFSGGWRMRVGLVAALFSEPDLLLLDEPTNYLDLEGVLWLEMILRDYRSTVMIISHDRDLLNGTVKTIIHLEQLRLYAYRGGYDDFERVRRERQTLALKAKAKQDTQRRHMQAFVDRFRYQANKARQAQSRLKALAKMQPIAALVEDPSLHLSFPEIKVVKSPLIVAEDVALGYDGKAVLRDLTFRIDSDDRIALLGKNGNGKTTLAKMLAGRLAPLAGQYRSNGKLSIGYFAQHQIDDLRPDENAIAHLARAMPSHTEAQVRSRLGGFGFAGEKSKTQTQNLSGGERSRLVLALITAKSPELLIFDEPTNHLDVDARGALAVALNAFQGAVILVSHDRHLVELVADRLWLVADGTVKAYDGDLDDYRRELLGLARRRSSETPNKAENGDDNKKKKTRQNSAQQRHILRPFRREIEKWEKQMEQATQQIRLLESQLGEPSIYQDAGKVTGLNKQLAAVRDALREAEGRWLQASEKLEQAEARQNAA